MGIWTEEQVRLLKEKYATTLNSELMLILNKNEGAIGFKAKKMGLEKKIRWNLEQDEFLADNILNYTNRELGKLLNRSQKSIQARLCRLNLKREDYKFTKYTEKEELYDNDAVLGYICGIIAADGCITDNPCERVALHLHEKDIKTTQFIVDSIIIEKYNLWKTLNSFGFTITVPVFIDFLKSIGITSKKSKVLNINIENKSNVFKLYFLRGVIDGDGCASYTGKADSYISIVSASKIFLSILKKYFGGNLSRRSTGYFDLEWFGYSARNLAKILPIDNFTMNRKSILIKQISDIIFFCEKGTSKFIGVQKSYGKYTARIQYQKKRYSLGVYDTEEEAARAYDIKAKELFGNKAKINFPDCGWTKCN